MSLSLHVALANNADEIIAFESHILSEKIPDESERMVQSWNARWRKESLEHYLQMGWSFLARDIDGTLVGLFLAQPLLFFDGQTQSLWIEHISFKSLLVRDQLCEVAYKLSREKHFQKVYFPNNPSILNIIESWKASEWKPGMYEVKTTKV